MKKLTDKEVATIAGLSKQAISSRKKTNKELYEIIRLGAICKQHNISEEEITKYLELKGLICSKNQGD